MLHCREHAGAKYIPFSEGGNVIELVYIAIHDAGDLESFDHMYYFA